MLELSKWAVEDGPMKSPLSRSHPDLSAQWHPTKNGSRTPDLVTLGSSVKVWWMCAHQHEWEDTPNHRTSRGSGCPYCAGRRILAGFNDVAHTHAHLAREWHPTKNGELTPDTLTAGSEKSVWWRDELGHEWQARVNNRANGTGCPYCSNNAVLPGFNDLATENPVVAAQWHLDRNHDLRPTSIAAQSNRKVWWQCGLGHQWQSTVNNRTSNGQGCPVCAGQKVLAGFNDLGTTDPALAAEWHPTLNAPLSPANVFRSTAKRFWWRDLLGHEWQASASERSAGNGCPFCSGQRILAGFNDLAARNPMLAAEWHPRLNGARTPEMVTLMNGTKAWWRCEAEHEWEARIASRASGAGCPACAGQTVLAGINDLASRSPTVAASWHPTRNGSATPENTAVFSNRKAWFRCARGHEWLSTVNNRTHGQDCPECSEKGGFNPGRPGYLYFLSHAVLGAHKVGITSVGTNRLDKFQLSGWQVIHLELFSRGSDAAIVERAIKRWWRSDLNLPVWLGPSEMAQTGGWSETISADELTTFECILRIQHERTLLQGR
ncbi:zinc-ribbon domain-containing protein [Rhodococcus qingshengii]|uniref:zinc-ribbon domain-containing protein n=2 Tax=Rhodococcus TaxID=1827 RepID=UPI0008162D39|nr:Probable Zinc-ribbon domain-containing protein [Rhodococcus qingshengii]